MGDGEKAPLRLQFNPKVRLEFHGSTITSDAGLLAFREFDDALGLTEIAEDHLQESRTGRNILHHLVPLLRQSIYSRLAGYDDTNDAVRLSQDPAMRVIVGWQGSERKGGSTSEMGRFETEFLTQEDNLKGLARINTQWVERAMAHTLHRRVILDMDSSESPVHGQQEGAAYNGHFECVCYHPLFLFNQFGDCEAAKLRSGNVHSADDWQEVLDPVVERYLTAAVRLLFRADAAFAKPEIYDYLEARNIGYAIRLRSNQVLQRAPMTVCGSCDARDGERIRSRELPRAGVARVCGEVGSVAGWQSGGELNGLQPGHGATELGFPRPMLRKMQGKAARRAGDPSHQGEEPPPEGLGGHDLLAQADARGPAGQVVGHHLDGQPGAVGGEAARRHVVKPDTVLEVANGVLDLGVAAMVGLQFQGFPAAVGDEAVIAVGGEKGQLGTGRGLHPPDDEPHRRGIRLTLEGGVGGLGHIGGAVHPVRNRRPGIFGYGLDEIAQAFVLADGDGEAHVQLAAGGGHGVGIEAAVGPPATARSLRRHQGQEEFQDAGALHRVAGRGAVARCYRERGDWKSDMPATDLAPTRAQ